MPDFDKAAADALVQLALGRLKSRFDAASDAATQVSAAAEDACNERGMMLHATLLGAALNAITLPDVDRDRFAVLAATAYQYVSEVVAPALAGEDKEN